MKTGKRIVLMGEDAQANADLREILQPHYDVLSCADSAGVFEVLDTTAVHLVIAPVAQLAADDSGLLATLRNRKPRVPCIVTTDYASIPRAVKTIQGGADDYLTLPLQDSAVLDMVNRLGSSPAQELKMVVVDQRSQHLVELARRVAESNATVMISGESGTGKEVFSQFIHLNSSRAEKPFVAINCAAIPETMLESILFGYEKGAFTGAATARAGKFEQANGGTLLLDEISEMDLGLQAKLLRVIQEKEVERLGGNRSIPLDVRLLATTNRNLKQEVQEGRFREDLFYRLNVFPLQLPPLRERQDDIVPLAQLFIENYQGERRLRLSERAGELLRTHHWQGNVRELENVIQRALIMASGDVIDGSALVFEEISAPVIRDVPGVRSMGFLRDTCLESDLKTLEKDLILDAISSNQSRKEAAEKLGISPRTLRYKMARFRKESAGLSV